MYHIAIIANETTLFDALESSRRRYFDGLIALHGPYEDITAATESVPVTGTISVESDTVRISTIQTLNNDLTRSIVLSRSTSPIRVLIALLAFLENFEVRDYGNTALPGDAVLTEREIEVLQFVSGGYSNSEIARFLKITERTVKYHVSEILRKLKVSSRTEAVVEAARDGIITL